MINTDGLCGIPATFSPSDLKLRCRYEFGHDGEHSFEKYKSQFVIVGGTFAIIGGSFATEYYDDKK